MSTFLQYLVNGVASGGVYVLVGVGVTLVYGLTRLVNFAHGEQLTLGGLLCYVIVSSGRSFMVGLIVAGAAAGLLGLIMERGGFRFTRAQPANGIILSIGLTLILQGIYFQIWEDRVVSIRQPFTGVWELGGVRIAQQRVVVVVVAGLLVAALFAILRWTRNGRAIRAYAQDPEATLLMGVDAEQLVSRVFVIGGIMAGFAGGLLLSLVPMDRSIGATFAVKAFMVAIVGGLGNPAGALLAGLLIGVAESLAGGYLGGGVAVISGLVAAIAILMVRPQGIMRGEEGAHL